MNEFIQWTLRHSRPWDIQPPLTEAEQDQLFELMGDPSLSEDAMSIEMADGYMTACIVGPVPVPVPHWLEAIFDQATLPLPHDTERQQRLLQLLLRRYADIDASTLLSVDETTPENILMPLSAHVRDEDRITPYRLDAQRERMGNWDLQDWAKGFCRAIAEDDAWEPLLDSADATALMSPLVLYSMGYNPDYLELQLEEQDDLVVLLIGSVCAMRHWWRAYHRRAAGARALAEAAAPQRREAPKVGRNDPCPCGSGNKYKKCCGA